MKSVLAEAIEGVGAFRDLLQETLTYSRRFVSKLITVNKDLFLGANSGDD